MKPFRAILILMMPLLVVLTMLLLPPLRNAPVLALGAGFLGSTLLVLALTELVTVESYQRLLISRGGHLIDTSIQGERALLLRPFDRAIPVDMRARSKSCKDIICFTREGVQVAVDYMFLWKVVRPTAFVMGPGDIPSALESIIGASLRNDIGVMPLLDVFQHREQLVERLLRELRRREEILSWGIRVQELQLGEVKIPGTVLEALSRQVTAEIIRPALLAEGQGMAQEYEQIEQVAGDQAWLVEAIKIFGNVLSQRKK
ncbi:MAG: SPFH domain-containing protein [Anaerolineae bacterium]